jgi:protein MpaA
LGFCLGPVFFVPNALAFDTKASPDFQKFLNALEWKAKNYGWDDLGLRNIPWEYYRKSVHNYPLMFVKFGNSSKNCVLFFGGIHGDELPSVYLMLQLAHYIQDNPDFFQDQCVVIAPLVNPDGFLSPTPTRTNASHVDLNRNFPTRDWKTSALKQWKARGANHRYFPGNQPASEREVLFQMALIKRFHPQKILSVHSPLNCFDYDGPSSDLDSFEKWMEQVSEESNHPLKKFGYYPGSLGNYAGHERNIFTITLELPSSDPQQSKTYFKKFQPSILKFINLPVTGVPPHIKMVNQ